MPKKNVAEPLLGIAAWGVATDRSNNVDNKIIVDSSTCRSVLASFHFFSPASPLPDLP